MKRILNYFKESWKELGKITWPNRQQTLKLTGAVALFSIIFAGFIGVVDYGFTVLVQKFIVKG